MSTEESILDSLRNCTIINGYAGLDDFKYFAQQHADAALRVIWKVLTFREDPGRDDGALCLELLWIVSDVGKQEAFENLILSEWATLSDGLRRNIIQGATSPRAMSTAFGLKLFEHLETRIEQRHLIAAGFAAGDRDRNCEGFIVDLAKRIGTYTEPYRQRILDQFVENVVRYYG